MEFVQLKICEHIAYITLNRSKVYNAINSEMVKQFSSCIEKIANKQQANLYESLIGALYLDGGLQPCKELILCTIWTHRIEAWKSTNYKGRLIEYCHSSSLRAPKFQVSNITGPDHQKIFEVHVQIDDKIFPPGMGSNKKTAEQSAAQNTLEILTN